MDILKKIVAHKLNETSKKKTLVPIAKLEQSSHFDTPTFSLKESICDKNKSGIIAEFKKKSPSKKNINLDAEIEKISVGYFQAGVSALSILTDEQFFGGTNNDLFVARKLNDCPILRKDFILEEYQIIEAKAIGADAILLIAKILEEKELKKLTHFAHSLNLEVLVEIHEKNELNKLKVLPDLIGINNRNLKTFKVDYNHSKNLVKQLPQELCKIAESGISSVEIMLDLKSSGFDGFLIGERFMSKSHPEKACQEFIKTYEDHIAKNLGL